MQHKTQLTEAPMRYHTRVLMGNWNEDRFVKEMIGKDFLEHSMDGSLKIDRFQANMSRALTHVDLTVARNDDCIHFGDVVQLAHDVSQAPVSVDASDVDARTGEGACSASVAPHITAPCARNTLTLAKYSPPSRDAATATYPGDTLRYGQKVRLIVNPLATSRPPPYHLFSKAHSTMHQSKMTRNQVVGFTAAGGYDTVFCILPADPSQAIAAQGVEVRLGDAVSVQHCATNALLCVQGAVQANDFGVELELCCCTVRPNGRKHVLAHLQHGKLADSIPALHAAPNRFRFVVQHTPPAPLPPPRPYEDVAAPGQLRSTP